MEAKGCRQRDTGKGIQANPKKGEKTMKQVYEPPHCEVIEFEVEDVITTSGESGEMPIFGLGDGGLEE